MIGLCWFWHTSQKSRTPSAPLCAEGRRHQQRDYQSQVPLHQSDPQGHWGSETCRGWVQWLHAAAGLLIIGETLVAGDRQYSGHWYCSKCSLQGGNHLTEKSSGLGGFEGGTWGVLWLSSAASPAQDTSYRCPLGRHIYLGVQGFIKCQGRRSVLHSSCHWYPISLTPFIKLNSLMCFPWARGFLPVIGC